MWRDAPVYEARCSGFRRAKYEQDSFGVAEYGISVRSYP